ncbi:MAG: sensor histidine kinase [Gemmatimonadota bacterium]
MARGASSPLLLFLRFLPLLLFTTSVHWSKPALWANVKTVKRLTFRSRLFLILSLFALAPAALLTAGIGIGAWTLLPGISADEAWGRVARTGKGAIDSLSSSSLTQGQRATLDAHQQELESSVTQARRLQFVASRLLPVFLLIAIGTLAILWIAASRVAAHLSRQLSRPIDELVRWTSMIERGAPLPPASSRGAPEFETLRSSMKGMAAELELSRATMREAERALAFRETARRVAHELKNPLTPIQFALAQIRRAPVDGIAEPLRVIEEETARIDRMARSFSQFGRLPEGPVSRIDVGELARATCQSALPSNAGAIRVVIETGTPEIEGRYDALLRALLNVVLNALDAARTPEGIGIRVRPGTLSGKPAAVIEVSDDGPGVGADRLESIWAPYVTDKVGGSGLGLAIARQTVLAHGGVASADCAPGSGLTIRFMLPATVPVTVN